MIEKTIAGIRRGNKFSPNHIGNDAAIFSLTVEQLRERGYKVNEYTESDLLTKDIREEVIFNMVRDRYSVRKLQHLEEEGRLVINSGFGIENCTREKMTRLFMSANIPSPRSIILHTDDDPVAALEAADFSDCWIKRHDFHAIHREDVTYVRHIEEAKSIMKEYAMRGITTAVINEHLAGDLVKFYGVIGTDFFYWFYPDMNHSKFGCEIINGKAHEIPFDKYALRQLCNEAARILNVVIYGGDCIIDKYGMIRLIDFNDWPSFAPCRNQAAPYIASCIHHLITT
ncbi:MAG: hypothetical protein LBE56_14145 [Tannerella sp.]|jgi:hypothetical protein|nr:hypothetical protein [Tannerella sp.]